MLIFNCKCLQISKMWRRLSFARQKLIVICLCTVLVILLCLYIKHMVPRYKYEYDIVHTAMAPAGTLPNQTKGSRIGIGCAITTRGIFTDLQLQQISSSQTNIVKSKVEADLKTIPFFTDLLPSFCTTASLDFLYKYYVAYDYNDPLLTFQHYRDAFHRLFLEVVRNLCVRAKSENSSQKIHVSLSFLKLNHTGKPARAQNDAMLEAFRDGSDYLFRINDDTQLRTARWTEAYVQTLLHYSPPNVGVVGPSFTGMYATTVNKNILTFDFVHRTHVDIFMYYYPPLLTTWFADDWITHVYQPNRSLQLTDVIVYHTQIFKERYTYSLDVVKYLDKLLDMDKHKLATWIDKRSKGKS